MHSPAPRKPRTSFGTLGQKGGKFYPSYVGPDKQRHRAPASFPKKSQAQAWLNAQHAAIDADEWSASTPRELRGTFIPDRKVRCPFGDYVEAHIAGRRNRRGLPLAPRTSAEYRRLLAGALHRFHAIAITDIRPEDVREWWDEQLDAGTHTQASHAYDLARQAMGEAVEAKLIGKNPFDIPGAATLRTGRKVRVPTDLEVETVLAAAEPRWRSMFLVEAWGQLRYGELAALRRGDVVIDSRVRPDGTLTLELKVAVERGVSRTKGEVHERAPKSEAGRRLTALPERASKVLDEWIRESVGSAPDALIWPSLTDPGRPIAYSVYWRYWQLTLERAGVAPFNPHSLRHYGLTAYAQAGATIREVQSRGGHSTITAAMKYQHAAVERASDLANAAATASADAAARAREKAELIARLAALDAMG